MVFSFGLCAKHSKLSLFLSMLLSSVLKVMLEAILKPIEDSWQVVIVDGDSEIIWSEPITLSEAQREADRYNARTTLVQDGLRRLNNLSDAELTIDSQSERS